MVHGSWSNSIFASLFKCKIQAIEQACGSHFDSHGRSVRRHYDIHTIALSRSFNKLSPQPSFPKIQGLERIGIVYDGS